MAAFGIADGGSEAVCLSVLESACGGCAGKVKCLQAMF